MSDDKETLSPESGTIEAEPPAQNETSAPAETTSTGGGITLTTMESMPVHPFESVTSTV